MLMQDLINGKMKMMSKKFSEWLDDFKIRTIPRIEEHNELIVIEKQN